MLNKYPTNWSSLAIVLDDHLMYTEFFVTHLKKTNLFSHVMGFTTGVDLENYLEKIDPWYKIYLFADYYLNDGPAVNIIKRLPKSIKVIIVSSILNPILILDILKYKVDGFLSKSSNTEEIITCLLHLNHNEQYISPSIKTIIDEYKDEEVLPFSGREIEILGYFAQGYTVNSTAEKMLLSRHTIISHRRRMMAKTKTNTITELLAYARKIELI